MILSIRCRMIDIVVLNDKDTLPKAISHVLVNLFYVVCYMFWSITFCICPK